MEIFNVRASPFTGGVKLKAMDDDVLLAFDPEATGQQAGVGPTRRMDLLLEMLIR